jgi:HK97 family phage prohead protease
MREHSSFSFKVKSIDEAGRFTGLLASFNTTDLGGDRILPGAFTKTLAATRSFPLLWQHKGDQPIGSFTAKETGQGLAIDGQLLLSIKQAADARELLKAGVLKGLSIGYDVKQSDYVGEVRELSELKLWEGSIVTFPMNESAMVTGIKQMSDSDRTRHFKAIDEHRKGADRHLRQMREHMKALFDGFDDDPDADEEGDPALLEGEGDDYGEMSAVIAELKALAEQAQELAEA